MSDAVENHTVVPAFPVHPTPPLARALPLGIVTALVVGVVWHLVVTSSGMQIGFVAIGAGFVIGYAMLFGARGEGSLSLQVNAMAVTLVTMFFAEYFISRTMVGQFLVSQGETAGLPIFFYPTDMVALVVDTLTADPITLGFWGFALMGAFRVTAPHSDEVQPEETAVEA